MAGISTSDTDPMSFISRKCVSYFSFLLQDKEETGFGFQSQERITTDKSNKMSSVAEIIFDSDITQISEELGF